ncbi:MAG: hypothetical protein OXI58_01675 [Gemmatimonadota bacterium]|nr:hypothetical protein [Gemmatimonadota bacterium]
MIQELKNYYYANGISAFGFRCHFANSCRLFCDNFVEAKEAYVGSEYDKQKGTLPRVLFLSSDPGGGDPNPQTRTMEAVRRSEEECDPESLPKNGHWHHTHKLAWILLKKFNPNLQFKDICPYFAHTNSAKCCEDYNQRAQSADRLFENCRGYIPREIQILDPDILITQGDSAKWAVEYGFSQSTTLIEIDSASDHCNYHLIQMNGKEVLWFASYHPNNPGGLYRRRSVPCFGTWAEEAYRRLG